MPDPDSPFLDGLNEEQRQAVTTTDGPLLVIAGPGSGKTRVIIQRIAYLVRECRVRPDAILAVTFTNRAAAEMINRLSRVLDTDQARAAQVSTFHRFCGNVNRRYSSAIGLDAASSIYDREDQMSVVKRAMEQSGHPPVRDEVKPREILARISSAKSRMMDPSQYASWVREHPDTDYSHEVAAQAYPIYQQELLLANALDFDDMIDRAYRIITQSESIRKRIHRRIQYVMVDEYQDTNHAQNELTAAVTGPHRNLCVVGDPNQSIYGWRDADISNIIEFQDRYPKTTVVRLGRNYRSTDTIVDAAQGLIEHNPTRLDNPLQSMIGPGPPIRLFQPELPTEETEWILDTMSERIQAGICQWKDCAVMYRVHAQSRPFEEACTKQGIPYRLIGGARFYDRREIRDILAYLRITSNPGDGASLERIINVPPRKIGAASVRKMLDFSSQHGQTLMQSVASCAPSALGQHSPPLGSAARNAIQSFHQLALHLRDEATRVQLTELFDIVVAVTGLEEHIKADQNGEERWHNALELRSLCDDTRYHGRTASQTLPGFLEHVSLVQNVDQIDPEQGVLTLITLHQAKGLEFDTVAMPGMTEGTLPLRNDDIQEERRLCYVGITRAERLLLMSAPEVTTRYGRAQEAVPSRFINELPADCIEYDEPLE